MAMAMIGIVLLIALFNVVGLLLARAVDREREMTLRGALGASRARLTQQLVTESLVIATAGGALALFVSRWSNNLLANFAPEAPVPQRIDVTPDWTVAAFTAGLMIICGIGAGLLPARRATSLAIATAMAPPTVIGGARAGRLRAIVVSMQVAGATLLLTMASLLVRNAIATAAVSVGFDTAHGIVLEIDPASHGYAEPAAQQFVADAITSIPRHALASSAPRSWTGCRSTSASRRGWKSRLTAGCARWRPARQRRAIASDLTTSGR